MIEPETGNFANSPPVFFVGTSGWTYDHWKGRFYPESLPRRAWFDHYAGLFSAVEINATFYGTFKDQIYLNWKERVSPGFGFALKAPRIITHRKYLVDVEADIRSFCRSAALLGEHLEMILLQLAPGTPYAPERLQKALLAFDDPARVAVEFRSPDWLTPQTENLLRAAGATFCDADSPRQKLAGTLTSSCAYLRLHGRRTWYSHNYSSAELQEIAGLVRDLARRGAKRIHIFFNNDYEGFAPANALALKALLGV